MFVHKLNHPTVGAMLALSVVVALSLTWRRHSSENGITVKRDRLEQRLPGQEYRDAGCSQAAWPFGCGWQLPVENGLTRRHSPTKTQRRPWLWRILS